jgi:hypothetical protein
MKTPSELAFSFDDIRSFDAPHLPAMGGFERARTRIRQDTKKVQGTRFKVHGNKVRQD